MVVVVFSIQLQGGDTSSCCKFRIFLGDVKGSPPKKTQHLLRRVHFLHYFGVAFWDQPRSDATASTYNQEVQPRDSMTSKRDGQSSLRNPRWLCETEPEEMRFWDHDPWKIRVTKRHGKYWLKVHIFSKVKKICQKSKDCLQDEGKYNSF